MLDRLKTIIKNKFTIGTMGSILSSVIFAIIVRHMYVYYLDFWPVRGELEWLDLTYFATVLLFRIIFSSLLEALLGDKYHVYLCEYFSQREGEKQLTSLSMDNTKPSSNSSESSKAQDSESYPKPEDNEDYRKLSDATKKQLRESSPVEGWNEACEIGDKMWDVLMEQEKIIDKLRKIKRTNDLEYYSEKGGLEISAPSNITDAELNSLSKKVGALDRGLLNKFAEYRNLSNKDMKNDMVNFTDVYKETEGINKKQYDELFEK